MNKQTIISRLLELPVEIAKAEQAVIEAQITLESAKNILTDAESYLLIGENTPVNGKNAEIRAAQLREYTKAEREAVTLAGDTLAQRSVYLRSLQNELKVLQSVALILGGEVA